MSLQRILKNSVYLLGMNLSSLGALFVFAILLARLLGKEALGLYAVFTAMVMPFAYLVDLGQSTSLVQEIGRAPRKAGQILKNTLLLKLVMTVVATALLFLVSSWYFDSPFERHLFWIFGLLLLPRAVYSTFEAAFRAHQRMIYPMWTGFGSAVLLIAGSATLLRSGAGFEEIVVFLVVVEIARAALSWSLFVRTMPVRVFDTTAPVDLRLCGGLLKRSLPFFAMGVVGMLYYRVDVVLLAAMRNTAEVGIFSAASSFVKVLRVAPSVIVASFFPAISALRRDSWRARRLSSKTLHLQFGASLALTTAVFFLAEPLIMTTFGFSEATQVLRVFVWSLVPLSLYSTLVYIFFHADRWAWNIWIMLAILALNVSLNLILIPRLGALALAVSSVVSESVSFLLYFGLFLHLQRTTRLTPLPESAQTVEAPATVVG